jgi:hypothetical protein
MSGEIPSTSRPVLTLPRRMRRSLLTLAGCLLALATLRTVAGEIATAPARRPNVIVIVTDDKCVASAANSNSHCKFPRFLPVSSSLPSWQERGQFKGIPWD